jgi:hypothetical protein
MSGHVRLLSSENLMKPLPRTDEHQLNQDGAGIPCRKKRLCQNDLWVLVIQAVCLSMAILTVFHQGIAAWLSSIRQLIVIGFLLGVMALAFQEQALRTALIFTGYSRASSIQDIDAFLRKDLFAPKVSLYLRLTLLLLIGLPLGLSVAYKVFVGGYSQRVVPAYTADFGFSALPGNQRIGDGLTLLSDIYRPFWINPAINKTYGFNLFIETNDTAVIPDTPYPSFLAPLQSSLADGESINLTTTVNATVCRLAGLSPEERNSSAYWQSVQDYYGHDWVQMGNNIAGANNGIWAGQWDSVGFSWNFSVVFLSAWNTTKNETFFSEAFRLENYRSVYHATWNVTNSDALLVAAKIADPSIPGYKAANQSTIQHELLGIDIMFPNFLGEYDWHNRAGFFQYPYPTAEGQPEKWTLDVNTVPALSAAMIWARVTSLNGGDRPNRNPDAASLTQYEKTGEEISMTKYIPTLKRSPWLLLVLCVNPILTLSCLVLKTLMYASPVGDNFNSIALLSAAAKSDLSILKGAGLSGKLSRKVGVRFRVQELLWKGGSDSNAMEKRAFLVLEAADGSKNGVLKHNTIYQ